MSTIKLTVVAPAFNEEEVIAKFHERLCGVLDTLGSVEYSIVYAVDKCSDDTLEILRELAKKDRRTRVIALSTRFGHQMSLMAGIENSLDSDAIVMMDSDLQHPPELIPELLEQFEHGADIVYTVRRDTEDTSIFRKAIGSIFYKFLNSLSDVTINPNSADFRLISNRVANVLSKDFNERNMFLRGLFSLIGFKQVGIEYAAGKRGAGVSKYSLSRMMQLALAGILSFSTKPLRVGIFIGSLLSLFAFTLMITTVFNYFVDRSLPSGWTTLITLLTLFSGVQLLVMGVMGAYIGSIYEEVKNRPRYIVEEEIFFGDR